MAITKFNPENLTQNPFSYSLIIEVTKRYDSGKFKLSHDGVMIPISQLLERQQSTKIYHCNGFVDMVCNLSDKAMRLYMYIVHSINSNEDYIKINYKLYMSKNNIKDKRTYTNAVNELIRYNFIAATGFDNVYWINPNIIFSGSRINKYPDNVVVKGQYTA